MMITGLLRPTSGFYSVSLLTTADAVPSSGRESGAASAKAVAAELELTVATALLLRRRGARLVGDRAL